MARHKGQQCIDWKNNPVFRDLLVDLTVISIQMHGGNPNLPNKARIRIAKDFQSALPWYFEDFNEDKTQSIVQQVNWALTSQTDSSLTPSGLKYKTIYQTMLRQKGIKI